ncbi:MAG: hypothetical protein ABIR05_03845 [Luteimonas sp.]
MNDFEFDRKAKAVHAQALMAPSARVRAQLHNRLQAAMSGMGASSNSKNSHPLHRWSWATAAVLVLALMLAAPWRSVQEQVAPANLAQGPGQLPANSATGLATLDQDPDFYLWLASSDAVSLAME